MSTPNTDKQFAGSIPKLYDTYLVPMIFAGYADDLVHRLEALKPSRVLEIAAGTGAVTRLMARELSNEVSIVATDLNEAMLDQAKAIGTSRPVDWRQADAMQLPFVDAQFDVVICQFGAMFFPDKPKAYAEIHRVLKPGGAFLFNVWDKIEENEFANVITQALAMVFPNDPPKFMARTPHGYHDPMVIQRDILDGGFKLPIDIETVTSRSRASAEIVALAYCQGTPIRNEIESRDASRLNEATRIASDALSARFGTGIIDGKIQAIVVCAKRSYTG